MKLVTATASLVALVAPAVAANAFAQPQPSSADHLSHPVTQTAIKDAAPRSEGEVRKVDLAQGKVTLRHGPIVNLDMPAMTMVFTAADKKLLQGLKSGDKVRFTAENSNGKLVVTALEVVR